DPSADELCRGLLSRLGNEPVTKSDDWGQSPLFYAAREGHTQLCKYLVEKCAMGVNQVDRWGETPLFYAMKWQRLETAIYLLQSGASMGILNKFGQSADRLATVEVARELQSRMKEWAEPLEARMKEWAEPLKASSPEPSGDSKKRKRPEEEEVEEPGSAAEGPRALQEWVAKPAKLPKNERTQLLREEPTVVAENTTHKAEEPAVLAENTTHKVTLLTADALEEVRELEKMLVAYQAALFQGHLFVQSCRALDFCSAFGGAKEKDSEFFEEYSVIVEDAGRGETGSLVLVAREETGRVVGYCRAEKSDGELVIRHLQVDSDQQNKGVGKLLLQAAETQVRQDDPQGDACPTRSSRANDYGAIRAESLRAVAPQGPLKRHVIASPLGYYSQSGQAFFISTRGMPGSLCTRAAV
ncbi:Tanc1, partial [Symbiodinium sp. CCMP2456]